MCSQASVSNSCHFLLKNTPPPPNLPPLSAVSGTASHWALCPIATSSHASVSPFSPVHLLCIPLPSLEHLSSLEHLCACLCARPSPHVTICVPQLFRNPNHRAHGSGLSFTRHTSSVRLRLPCGVCCPSRCLESGRGGGWALLSVAWVSVTPSFLTARFRVLDRLGAQTPRGLPDGRMGPPRRGGC